MDVLVAYASANGSTAGVAERIATRLRERGLEAVAIPARGDLPGDADAVVLGSAIHNGKWLRQAVEAAPGLASGRAFWLFSVCSVGDTRSFFGKRIAGFVRKRRREQPELAALRSAPGFRGHRYFAGAIRPGDWGRVGTIVLRLAGGKFGDHRDWGDIDRWAERIGDQVMASHAVQERSPREV